MRHVTAIASPDRAFRARLSLLALALFFALGILIASFAHAKDAKDNGPLRGIRMVAPGMNQTELQYMLGPPDYIQSNGPRQAWQYCPNFFERILRRRGNFIVGIERLLAHKDSDFFITVWFVDGQVDHIRAYPEGSMGSCADFYAAFRWEDFIDGEFPPPGMGVSGRADYSVTGTREGGYGRINK